MKTPYLFPAALAVVFMSSVIIIISPIRTKTFIPVPAQVVVSKTYQDQSAGFQIQYPSNFNLTDNSFQTPHGNKINISVLQNNSKTIADFLIKQDKISATAWEGMPSKDVRSIKKTVINGLNAIQREEFLLAADATSYSTYFKIKSNFIFVTLFITPGSDSQEDVSTYQQIIASFKAL